MSVTVTELGGWTLDEKGGTARYKAVTSANEAEAAVLAAAQSTAPATYANISGQLPRSNVKVTPQGGKFWLVEAMYGNAGGGSGGGGGRAPLTGDVTLNLEIGGATQHITQAEQHVADYKSDYYASAAPDYKGAIGVETESLAGVDIAAKAFAFTVTLYVSDAAMTDAYLAALTAYAACTNDDSFSMTEVRYGNSRRSISFAAQEVLYIGASVSPREPQGDWTVTLRFTGSPNRTSITIASQWGDITGIAKAGTDYLWSRYLPKSFGTGDTKVSAPQPISAHTEQVYLTFDISNLNP